MTADALDIRIGTLDIAGWSRGPVDAPLVLCLHGWLDNAGSFATLVPRLADARPDLRFVAIDLPGHGRSSHRPDGAMLHFLDGVVDIADVLDALGADRVRLLGHSMGAALSTLFAAAMPDRVERLILLDGLGPLSNAAETTADQLAKGIAGVQKARARSPRPYPSAEAIRARIREANPGHTDAALDALVERGVRETDAGFVFAHDPRLKASSLSRLTEDQVVACLDAITAPTTLIWAREGFARYREAMGAREAALPDATVHLVDGGHHVHLNHPDRVAPHVLAALAEGSDA